MFSYKRIIRMRDTDATGALYFANQLQFGLEAFEEFLHRKNFFLRQMLREKKFFLPIVHTESDFFSPITIGEEIEILLTITHIGNRSFSHCSQIELDGKKVGKTSIVHVSISSRKKESIPLPLPLRELLEKEAALADLEEER